MLYTGEVMRFECQMVQLGGHPMGVLFHVGSDEGCQDAGWDRHQRSARIQGTLGVTRVLEDGQDSGFSFRGLACRLRG